MSARAAWFVLGAGAGLYAARRARKLAYRLTPEGVADQIAAASVGVRAFLDEMRDGISDREAQLVDDASGLRRASRPAPDAVAGERPMDEVAASRSRALTR